MITFKEFINSFKKTNYECEISSIKKYFIDEMLVQNCSYDVITKATSIPKNEIDDYFHNEWSNKYPDRYTHIMFVRWVNEVASKEEKIKK